MTRYQRSMQIWAILVVYAHQKRTTTYGELAKLLGFKGAGVFAHLLNPLMCWCYAKGYPPLTALVFNQASGKPGSGLSTVSDLPKDVERVHRFDWFAIQPPTEACLESTDTNAGKPRK